MTETDSRLKLKPLDGRRAERVILAFDAHLREPGATKFSVRVCDLSVTGFRCETSFTLYVDSMVWLTIPGLQGLEARVMWKDKYAYGFAFTSPLHPAVLDHIARIQKQRG